MVQDTPTILNEAQRAEVRTLLKRLSNTVGKTTPKLNENRPTKRMKRMVNPFEDIKQGESVNGTQLSADACTLTFIQRSRIVILPYFYDEIGQSRDDWIKMVMKYTGACIGESTDTHLKFCVMGNPPVKYLHIYLKKKEDLYFLENFLYAT